MSEKEPFKETIIFIGMTKLKHNGNLNLTLNVYDKEHSSKYSDIAASGEIFILEKVYKELSDEYKDVWTQSAKYKGTKLFLGYVRLS